MVDVIDPLGYALLSPAPWQVRNLPDAAASGEMLVWYALLGTSLFAWRAEPRPESHQRLFVVCLILYGFGNWLVLAASEGNLGNLLRHRVMLTPTLVILGSAGLVWLWPRLRWLPVLSRTRTKAGLAAAEPTPGLLPDLSPQPAGAAGDARRERRRQRRRARQHGRPR